jgi:hypothetical protein
MGTVPAVQLVDVHSMVFDLSTYVAHFSFSGEKYIIP